MAINIIERHITQNMSYVKNAKQEDGRYIKFQQNGPCGAVLHSIGTPQPSALPIVKYFDSPDVESSVHMVLQADGTCYQCAPLNYRMWHVGGTANNTHIGIEMTEPKEISYDPKNNYKLTILNREKALIHVRATYERAVELFADLCMEYGWDPLEDGVILSHAECYKRGIGSNHGDPEHLWDALKTGYTMDTFRADVANEMKKRLTKEKEDDVEMRYNTLAELKADSNGKYYLPTIEKLIAKDILRGKGGSGDELVLDLGEDAIRIMVTLDRAGVYGE